MPGRMGRTIAMLLLGTLLAGCVGAEAQEAAWKSDPALLFLHRAACLVAPENTAPALEEAVRQGADGVEIDIRRTRDGVFILYHDDWVLRQRGTAGKIEEMTLAETQKLDVGERFGPHWKGLRPPLLVDALRFAKANGLRLYLDIKSPGIYEEVLRFVEAEDCLPLVYASGGQVPENHIRPPLPWTGGWNYNHGGEEDPERIRRALADAPQTPYGIMADDARSIARVLGRRPEQRPFAPFASTLAMRMHLLPPPEPAYRFRADDLSSPDAAARRAACIALARRPRREMRETLLALAESDPEPTARQEALWALGSLRDSRAVPALLRIARLVPDPAREKAGDYSATFLKIAAACALARLRSPEARATLEELADSPGAFDATAAAIGLSAFGTPADFPLLLRLMEMELPGGASPAEFILGYIGRFGAKAIPLYLAALPRDTSAKYAVFGLANIGPRAIPALRKAVLNESLPLVSRRRAALALYWMRGHQAEAARRRLLARLDLPPEARSALRE